MSFSDFIEKELLDHVFGNAAYSAPATLYIALSTADPTDSGGSIAEPADTYARQAVTNNATEWPAATGTTPTLKDHANAVIFPTATASWGTITHYAIFDAVSGGNMLAHATLDSSVVIGNGDTFVFAAGNIKIQLD